MMGYMYTYTEDLEDDLLDDAIFFYSASRCIGDARIEMKSEKIKTMYIHEVEVKRSRKEDGYLKIEASYLYDVLENNNCDEDEEGDLI